MIDDEVCKSRKDAIEDKIIGYYVKGKLSEDHRQLLKDKISSTMAASRAQSLAPKFALSFTPTSKFGSVKCNDTLNHHVKAVL